MRSHKFIAIFVFLGDFCLFYFSLYFALFLRNSFTPSPRNFEALQEPFLYLFIAWAFVLFIMDFYEAPFFRKSADFLRGLVVFFAITVGIGTAYFYLQPQLELTPRAILFLTAANFTATLSVWRYLLSFLFNLKNLKKKMIIIGFCEDLKEILNRNLSGYEIIGLYDIKGTAKEVGEDIKIENIAELKKISKNANIAVLTPQIKEDKKIIKEIFSSLPFRVYYIEFSTFYEEITKKIPLYSIDELWFLENISSPRKKLSETMKRIIEIFFSFFGLIFTAFLFPVIALLIKMDSRGPVLYKQERMGAGGNPFVLYKFRTMKKGEDTLWREKDKGEVTRVGSILRKIHLDEFPQFYNILKGDLSFVGPRPEWIKLAYRFEKEIPFYNLRYLVRPGLTGWAQLHYPPSTSIEEAKEKFKYDLYYIKNRSLSLDFVIILKTLRTVFLL